MVSTAFSASPFTPSHSQQRASSSPQKKAMSITQTYFLAHKARAKLSNEAARPDHNLRLLVGHANLLDSLMLDLADAEREQESWFNQSVRGAAPTPAKTEERHVQWADSISEEHDWDADSSDSDSDMDEDEEDIDMADAIPLMRIPSRAEAPRSPQLQTMAEFEDDDDEEDFDSLNLTRLPSHSASPPELGHDSDSSEDESMPPSPPTAILPTFSEKQRDTTTVTTKYLDTRQEDEDKSDFYDDGFYLPSRNPARLVSAISVY